MTHLNYSLKKLGKTFKLQKEFLKTEMNHVEVDGKIHKLKKRNGLIMLNKMCYVQHLVLRDIVKLWKLLVFQYKVVYLLLDWTDII